MILFDALGTLVGLEPPWQPLRSLLAERHGVQVSLEDAARALRAEIAYYRQECGRAGDAESLAALRSECAELLSRELGVAVGSGTLLDALRFRPYPEVRATLQALRECGERIVVISNWDVSLHEVLQTCGLGQLVDRVITSAEIGSAKPAPDIFRAALDGADPAGARHVGDSVLEDVRGAIACGIEPVLLARGEGPLLAPRAGQPSPPPNIRIISDLNELLA